MDASLGAAVLTSDILFELRDYWLRLRGASAAMPAPGAVDPLAIPRALPHVVLTDVTYDPLRFRYRLIGTKVTELAGRDETGRYIDRKLYGDNTERVLWAYRRCIANRAPVAVREPVQFADKDWIIIEALFLPLGDTAGDMNIAVARVLSGIDVVGRAAAETPVDARLELDWRQG